MKKTGYRIVSLIIACLLCSSAPQASIPDATDTPDLRVDAPKAPAKHARLWNLQNADILSIINEVSMETGKNFAVDPRVSGKISLISSKPVQPNEVYDIFLSVLGLLGYSAVPAGGGIIKIVPNMESSEAATTISTTKHPGRHDEVVVRIIPLERVSANQLIPVIRPMLPQWSNIAAYTPGNVLVLIGQSANLKRIVKVIHQIDASSANDIEVIPLHQAAASQVAAVLSRLQSASRSAGDTSQVSIAADDRSNSILLSGNRAERLHLRYLINRLDTPAGAQEGNTTVIYLRYLQAKNFAPLLGRIAQNMQSKSVSDGTAAAGTAGTTKEPVNRTSIQAEPSTNAIIITAPPTMMRALRSVVAKLDIRPAQVLVEGIIVEVSQDDLRNLGIQWGTLVSSYTSAAGSVGSSPSVIATDFPLPGAGNIGIIPHTNIAAILSFLQARNDTDILSTPSISVLDNHKATLEIGQEVPYTTGSYATTGSSNTVTPFNTTTNKPVTLKLTVVPQINLGNAVRLSIDLKNDSLQNPDSPGTNPIINTSNIKNAVIINSEDVLVLGGLISNSSIDHINKVPLLGDLPIVGKTLFQQKIHKIQKKNLLVFIKPTILRTPTDSENITQSKYDLIRERQIQFPEDLRAGTQSQAPHVLPLWKSKVDLPSPFSIADSS